MCKSYIQVQLIQVQKIENSDRKCCVYLPAFSLSVCVCHTLIHSEYTQNAKNAVDTEPTAGQTTDQSNNNGSFIAVRLCVWSMFGLCLRESVAKRNAAVTNVCVCVWTGEAQNQQKAPHD